MINRGLKFSFFMVVYLSGILIGGVYTPAVIAAYTEQPAVQKNVKQEDIQQKPTHLKKRLQRSVQLG